MFGDRVLLTVSVPAPIPEVLDGVEGPGLSAGQSHQTGNTISLWSWLSVRRVNVMLKQEKGRTQCA